MGNAESCEDQIKRAYHCFQMSQELSRQFKAHMRVYLQDKDCISSNRDSCNQSRTYISKKVESDFAFAMKHFNDKPRPKELTTILNTYPTLLQFLPKCAPTTCKVKL